MCAAPRPKTRRRLTIQSVITVKQAADLFKVTPLRVRQLMNEGRIRGAHKLGRDWLLPDKPGNTAAEESERRTAGEEVKRRNRVSSAPCPPDHNVGLDWRTTSWLRPLFGSTPAACAATAIRLSASASNRDTQDQDPCCAATRA